MHYNVFWDKSQNKAHVGAYSDETPTGLVKMGTLSMGAGTYLKGQEFKLAMKPFLDDLVKEKTNKGPDEYEAVWPAFIMVNYITIKTTWIKTQLKDNMHQLDIVIDPVVKPEDVLDFSSMDEGVAIVSNTGSVVITGAGSTNIRVKTKQDQRTIAIIPVTVSI
ncbi:hypothetical protein JJJA_0019 [Achromobacter phage JWDelta]|uniref:BIG2 domain-containing protein n=2 Tax=Jwalphavirus jwalpha TaxID=2169963 RepID=V9VCU2_9CAUD|nr:hypothetical protein CH29_gp19 [Achromobacter phage JWAlpha]AHC56535.1 hypothetical protein JJJA_0019 [Achromobacter phage JWDelta]AHC93972.1 hypothetical protein JJJB_0019 [Achromobacter phage JWAlpha]